MTAPAAPPSGKDPERPTAMALMSPELILVSYSCALRDHMVRLMRARPVNISSERFAVSGRFGYLAHPHPGYLGGRDAQRHLIFREAYDKQLQLKSSNLLFFDRDDLTHSISGIDDDSFRT